MSVLVLVAFAVLISLLAILRSDGSIREWLNSPISELKVEELLFILFVTALLTQRTRGRK